jgi:CheY-like chemotaxis protein
VSHPRLPEQAPSISPRTMGRTDAGRVRETILVVEDEDFVRQVTCEVLEFEGYRVLKARSAAEAAHLFHLCGGKVQLLLTDVVLPGRNGCHLARDLVAFCPALKTLFVSGYPENEVARHGLPEKGAPYLPKPFSVAALTRMVRHVLDERKARAPRNGNGRKMESGLSPAVSRRRRRE